MGTIGSEQTSNYDGKTAWVGNKKVSADGRWLGNELIERNPEGKVTKIGDRVAKRNSYGKITHLGDDEVKGDDVNLD